MSTYPLAVKSTKDVCDYYTQLERMFPMNGKVLKVTRHGKTENISIRGGYGTKALVMVGNTVLRYHKSYTYTVTILQ